MSFSNFVTAVHFFLESSECSKLTYCYIHMETGFDFEIKCSIESYTEFHQAVIIVQLYTRLLERLLVTKSQMAIVDNS